MVVAIIALLVAILLPALSEAKELSRRAVCGSNLHMVGIGLHLYANEFEGEMPIAQSPTGCGPQLLYYWGYDVSMSGAPWYGLGKLYSHKFIDDGRVFFCPSSGNARAWGDRGVAEDNCVRLYTGDTESWTSAVKRLGGNPLAYNTGIFSINSSYLMMIRWNPGYVYQPEGWMDGRSRVRHNLYKDSAGRAIVTDWYQYDSFPETRVLPGNHDDQGTNVLYLDAHVQWWSPTAYLNYTVDDTPYDL